MSHTLKVMNPYELEKWAKEPGSSIYVESVSEKLTEEIIITYFTDMKIGKVERIDFVPKYNANRQQIGRMMFVHFKYWQDLDFTKEVAKAHPNPKLIRIKDNDNDFHVLKCRVNCRPIQKVEYNTHQLTDMFERLNERVMNEIGVFRAENANLKIMIEKLMQSIKDESVVVAATSTRDIEEQSAVKEEEV